MGTRVGCCGFAPCNHCAFVSTHLQYHSTVTARDDDPKQRQWTVLDPYLILPEYAVEIEYDWGDTGSGSDAPVPVSGRSRDKEGVAPTTMVAELTALASMASAGGACLRGLLGCFAGKHRVLWWGRQCTVLG